MKEGVVQARRPLVVSSESTYFGAGAPGIAGAAAGSVISSNSTSKISVAFGGIGPRPRSPYAIANGMMSLR